MRVQIKNTGIEPLEEIAAENVKELEEALKGKKLTAIYSDGSRKNFGIRWDAGELDAVRKREATAAEPGSLAKERAHEYKLHGRAVLPEYEDILVEQRADPYVIREGDWYYFTASYPVCGTKENVLGVGYDRIVLRRAHSLQELSAAEEVTIWHQKTSQKTFRYIWAPELHQIAGAWYVIFTASVEKDNVWGIRPHMLKCMGADLMNPANWNLPDESNLHRVEAVEADRMSFRHFSLDMTYFSHRGVHYVAWAEIPEKLSNIYLASVDPKEPWKLKSPAVLLTSPEYDWEMRGNVRVNEGPAVLKHGGKLYLAYSASAVDYNYCIGILEAKEEEDLLSPGAWKKYAYPFLGSADFKDQCGPGHNSFTTDENGNVVLVYHARPCECSNAQDAAGHYGRCEYVEPGQSALSDPCRHARAKAVNFAADGLPVLHLMPEEELAPEYREVALRVILGKRGRSQKVDSLL